MDAAILTDITKDFPVGEDMVRVLHGISTSFAFGELSMLVGPSGCGKTTLISILTGILSATSGEADILGVRLSSLSDRKKVVFRRETMGFIFQQYNLLPALTAAENASIPLIAAGVSERVATDKARAILNDIGMKGQSEKFPNQLSGGQQQRVAIARAIVHEPKLIVCDEPTAALDEQTGHLVMQILKDRAQSPERAVVVVTHDNRIFDFADRIVRMNDGRVVGDEGPLASPTAQKVLSHV